MHFSHLRTPHFANTVRYPEQRHALVLCSQLRPRAAAVNAGSPNSGNRSKNAEKIAVIRLLIATTSFQVFLLPFFVIVRNPVCRQLFECFGRVKLACFDLFANLLFEPIFFVIPEVFALELILRRLKPEIGDVIRATGTERPEMINFSRLTIPFRIGNIVFVIHLQMHLSRYITMSLRVSAAPLISGAIVRISPGEISDI